jgi:spore coat protein U-like protein
VVFAEGLRVRYKKVRKCWFLANLLSVNLFFKEIIMRTLNTLKIVAVIAMALGLATAQAGSLSAGALGTGAVTATAVAAANCTSFTNSNALAFGSYASGQVANVDSTQVTLTATCTPGTVYTIQVTAGSNFGLGPWGGGYRALKATNSANYLSYGVYYGSIASNAFWGDGVNGSLGAVHGGTGNNQAQLYYLNARLYGGQTAVADTYGDASLTATISF